MAKAALRLTKTLSDLLLTKVLPRLNVGLLMLSMILLLGSTTE